MNKSELIDAMADAADITKASAGKALDGMLDAVMQAVKEGDTVTLIGFGAFMPRERAAREGHNPRTGAKIKIAASTIPAFKPGKAFKELVK